MKFVWKDSKKRIPRVVSLRLVTISKNLLRNCQWQNVRKCQQEKQEQSCHIWSETHQIFSKRLRTNGWKVSSGEFKLGPRANAFSRTDSVVLERRCRVLCHGLSKTALFIPAKGGGRFKFQVDVLLEKYKIYWTWYVMVTWSSEKQGKLYPMCLKLTSQMSISAPWLSGNETWKNGINYGILGLSWKINFSSSPQ